MAASATTAQRGNTADLRRLCAAQRSVRELPQGAGSRPMWLQAFGRGTGQLRITFHGNGVAHVASVSCPTGVAPEVAAAPGRMPAPTRCGVGPTSASRGPMTSLTGTPSSTSTLRDCPNLSRSWPACSRISIDHLGLSAAGLPRLLDAVDRGIRVKATGFGRLSLNVADALRRIDAVNPQALMFGTDLPGTRAPRAFTAEDLDVISDTLGDDASQRLSDNARSWYRI